MADQRLYDVDSPEVQYDVYDDGDVDNRGCMAPAEVLRCTRGIAAPGESDGVLSISRQSQKWRHSIRYETTMVPKERRYPPH